MDTAQKVEFLRRLGVDIESFADPYWKDEAVLRYALGKLREDPSTVQEFSKKYPERYAKLQDFASSALEGVLQGEPEACMEAIMDSVAVDAPIPQTLLTSVQFEAAALLIDARQLALLSRSETQRETAKAVLSVFAKKQPERYQKIANNEAFSHILPS